MSLEYIKEQLIIGFKTIKEYKINLYMAILAHLTYTIVTIFFVDLFSNTILNYNLSFNEVLFYSIFIQMNTMIGGFLRYNLVLAQFIKKGQLNLYLSKPIHPYLQYTFSIFPEDILVLAVLDFLILIGISIYSNFSFEISKILVVMLVSLIGITLFVSIFRLFDILAFYIKENKFLMRTYGQVDHVSTKYPQMYSFDGIEWVVFVIGSFSYGILPSLHLFNSEMVSLSFLVMVSSIQLAIIFLNIVLIIYLYKKGIKKYEAFG